jgi:heat shock protein HslJ
MIALAIAVLAASPSTPADYRALGTEPFWSLTISGSRIRLSEPGRPNATVLAPRAQVTKRGRRYVARAVSVDIVREQCSDGMSDRSYPDRVTVRWRGRVLKGCGGMANEAGAVTLDGTSWRIATIGGQRVTLGASAVTLSFAGDRVSGQAGCNRLNGRWQLEGGALTLSEIAMTRRACFGEAETIEARFNALAASPLTITRRGETIVLTNAGGSMTLAKF